MYINNLKFHALIDSGSTANFIYRVIYQLSLNVISCDSSVSMASTVHVKSVSTYVITNVKFRDKIYDMYCDDFCVDIILGLNFQTQHDSVMFKVIDNKLTIEICGLSVLNVEPPNLFCNILRDCKTIATKSRKCNSSNKMFIKGGVQYLPSEGIIEPSTLPWRAQVVVTKDDNYKKRLAVDYSRTINKFRQLDAYPLPNMNDLINKIAQFKFFSSVNLKYAYHQIPLRAEDRPYTAFEADGQLVQSTRMSFGVNNGVVSREKMDQFISTNDLENTFAFIDDVYICGGDQ